MGGEPLLMGFGHCLSFLDAKVSGIVVEAGGAAYLWAVQVSHGQYRLFMGIVNIPG